MLRAGPGWAHAEVPNALGSTVRIACGNPAPGTSFAVTPPVFWYALVGPLLDAMARLARRPILEEVRAIIRDAWVLLAFVSIADVISGEDFAVAHGAQTFIVFRASRRPAVLVAVPNPARA